MSLTAVPTIGTILYFFCYFSYLLVDEKTVLNKLHKLSSKIPTHLETELQIPVHLETKLQIPVHLETKLQNFCSPSN
jgi:hypothetical protein